MLELKTHSGHVVKLKSEITGGEFQDIQDVLFDGTELNQDEEIRFNALSLGKMRDKSIEVIVLEVDGNKDNILERVRSLPAIDYNQVVKKVTEIREGITEEKKTK